MEIKILMRILKTLCLIKDRQMLLISPILSKFTNIMIKIPKLTLLKLKNKKRLRLKKEEGSKALILEKV